MVPITRTLPAADRFWLKVNKGDGKGCWLWTGALSRDGYGSFGGGNGKSVLAHRFSYLLANGSLPTDQEICHHCDNPSCVRPEHLFAATHAENMADSVTKGRLGSRPAKGDRNGGNKYRPSVIRRVLALAGTMSQQAISSKTGVSQSHVSRIIRHQSWTCLHS